jgi:hypothetical protein
LCHTNKRSYAPSAKRIAVKRLTFCKPAELEPIGRRKTQKRPPGFPIPYIKIKAFSPIDLLLHLIRKVRVAEDNDLNPFQELLMGKRFEGRGRGGSIRGMIFFITPVAPSPGDLDGKMRAR